MKTKDIMITFRCESSLAEHLNQTAKYCKSTRSDLIRATLCNVKPNDQKKFVKKMNESR
jgi:hypothetical protein